MVRHINQEDHQAVVDIYNYYIRHSIVTFEEEPIDLPEISSRIAQVSEKMPWLVYEDNGTIQGYAYASPWKGRSAYRYCAECTVYLAHSAHRQGIGTQLYEQLIGEMKDLNYHVLIGGIALPNPGSIALHEKMGFEKVAHFREVGFKFDTWIDVGYWQIGIR